MQNFDLDIQIKVGLIVPQEFTEQLRAQAKEDTATEFLKNADANNPDDADFTLVMLQNGIANFSRRSLAMFFAQAGLGYKFEAEPGLEEVTNLEAVPAEAEVASAEVVQ